MPIDEDEAVHAPVHCARVLPRTRVVEVIFPSASMAPLPFIVAGLASPPSSELDENVAVQSPRVCRTQGEVLPFR